MTVRQLIDELNKVEDKSKEVMNDSFNSIVDVYEDRFQVFLVE